MKNLKLKLKKMWSNKLTLMLIPHNIVKPLRFEFSFSFALTLLAFWTGLTCWASVAVFTNVDYWSMKVDHQILKLKVTYFAQELKRSREVLDKVQEADVQLRQLLGMHNRKTIIEAAPSQDGLGGPDGHDRSILAKTLENRLWDISNDEIHTESQEVVDESEKTLKSFKEISEYIALERAIYRCTPKGWPVQGRITSRFGERVSPFEEESSQFHQGIDIANSLGTSVRATADGIVQCADWEGGYGRLVIINHGYGYLTYYGHNSQILVKPGQAVKRGDVIAYMGSSGRSTGPHTHYEVWRNGRVINPWIYLTAQSVEDLRTNNKLALK